MSHGRGMCICVRVQCTVHFCAENESVCKRACMCTFVIHAFYCSIDKPCGKLIRKMKNKFSLKKRLRPLAPACKRGSGLTQWAALQPRGPRCTPPMSESIRFVKVSPERDADSLLALLCGSACSLTSQKWISLFCVTKPPATTASAIMEVQWRTGYARIIPSITDGIKKKILQVCTEYCQFKPYSAQLVQCTATLKIVSWANEVHLEHCLIRSPLVICIINFD